MPKPRGLSPEKDARRKVGLQMIKDGKTAKEVAAELGVTIRGVKYWIHDEEKQQKKKILHADQRRTTHGGKYDIAIDGDGRLYKHGEQVATRYLRMDIPNPHDSDPKLIIILIAWENNGNVNYIGPFTIDEFEGLFTTDVMPVEKEVINTK